MSGSGPLETARPVAEVVVAGHVSLDLFPTLYGPLKIEPGRQVVVGPAVLSTGGVRGRWRSSSTTTRIWCPASSLAAGTTHAFHLLEPARKHGARAGLFGRKIKASEHQLTFVSYLRAIADGELGAAEAVRAYHGELARLGISPHLPLADDLALTQLHHDA
jgi:hypothetical protein